MFERLRRPAVTPRAPRPELDHGAPRPKAAAPRRAKALELGPGEPLPGSLRARMERGFQSSFEQVRVHTSAQAAEAAEALGARALTAGRDIAFAPGEYDPQSLAGRLLVAHELAHVKQSTRGSPPGEGADIETAGSHAEAEASRAGALVGMGLPAGPIRASRADLALTRTSDQVVPLISYSITDFAVTADEERQVLTLLRADPDLSATVVDLSAAGMLRALLERVDEPANRRDLLRLLGGRLNATARRLVEPIIQDLDVNTGAPQSSQLQYNLGRLGVSGAGAAFDRTAYNDLISPNAMAPFTGSGATGVNPSERGYTDLLRAGTSVVDPHINPVGDLGAYLAGLTPDQRRRQVELLVRQPISTNFAESYAGQIPSRLQVIRAVADANRLEPELVTAIILSEQRDQSRVEDARDYIGGLMFLKNTSIGLGQVVVSTARSRDLFSSVLTNDTSTTYAATTARSKQTHEQLVYLLASDEFNIAAVAKYIRMLADQGARHTRASLPNTVAEFPGLDPAAYANHSSTWPEDNVAVLGMYYTSRPWTDDTRSAGWGWFVREGYRDAKAARVF